MIKWKKIDGFDDYLVSNSGLVKSIKFGKERILSPRTTRLGYLQLSLTKNGKGHSFLVHVLVANAFLLKQKTKLEVNHIDGNKKNNNLSNLELCTKSENILHAFKNGLKSMKGENHSKNKLNDKQVLEIRKKHIPRKYTLNRLSKEYGVSTHAISDIVYGKSWKHLL